MKYLTYFFIILFLTSCGGGGGSTPTPSITFFANPVSLPITNSSTLTWSSNNTTSCSATWTESTATSGTETLVILNVGDNIYTISCTGDGGESTASVTIEGYRVVDGVSVDGYISGAQIFIDQNSNFTYDPIEETTSSDNDGKFTIRYFNGNLISLGGFDFDTQVQLDDYLIYQTLTGHTDNKVITPVTTIASLMSNPENINTALGIDSSINIFEFDPVASKGDAGANDQLYVLGNRLTVFALGLKNAVNQIQSSTDTTKDYFQSIAEEIESQYNTTSIKVDITDTQFVWNVMDNVTQKKNLTYADEMQDDYIKSGIYNLLPVIGIKSTPELTNSVMRFALSTFQDDIKILAQGGQTADDLDGNYSSNILEYIGTNQSINGNDIAPSITAINDTASVDEDSSVDILVINNDDFLNGAPISLTSTNGTIGSTQTSVGIVTYSPNLNQNGTDTFEYTLNQAGKSSTATVSVDINPVNDAPVINVASTLQAAENQTSVATISVADVDGDSLALTLTGTDAEIFNLSSEYILTFKQAPDFETKEQYFITLSLTDGNEVVTKDVSVLVTNVNDVFPVFTSGSFNADENQTAIGKVTATDVEGDNLVFSISGDEMTITSDGVLSFVSAPDYETKSSYSASVSVSDGINSTSQALKVTINDITEASVSGLAYTSRYTVIDSDIPNTDYLSDTSNDTVASAQAIINPSRIVGFVGGDDGIDVFSVSTTSSMYVNLDVIDYVNDTKELRLYIYESNGDSRSFSYTSASVENNMTVLLPNSGDYLVAVDDLNGSSKYILTLGQRYESSSLEHSTDFIPDYVENEFISYKSSIKINSSNKSILPSNNDLKKVDSTKSELFDLTGENFDEPGSKKFRIIKSKNIQPNKAYAEVNSQSNITELGRLPEKQISYLNQWSQLQHLRSLRPDIIFDFNYKLKLTSFTRDPFYSYQWNLQRVNLEPALNAIGQDVKDVAVAVIDSGGPTPNSAAWNESNLIDGGYDFVSGNTNSVDYLASDNYTGTDSSHGTHVSTTIAAKNNGASINGYAVKAMNINVFPVVGTGANAETGSADNYSIIQAIRYASGLSNDSASVASNTIPIKVINLSLGGPSYSEALCAAVSEAITQGITVVAASGNAQDTDPGQISYPASCSGTISVGATNSAGEITSYSQQNAFVDIAAPGGDMFDRDGDGIADLVPAYINNNNLAGLPGTSMASPQVSAAIALMYAVDSTMTPSRVESMMVAGELSDDRGVSGRDNIYGYGELNVAKAIENVLEDTSSSTTFAYTSIPYLDFSNNTTQLTIDLTKVGTGSLSVSNLTADSATGLTYNSGGTDSKGFGTYTIFLDRSSIPTGEFSNTIYFNLSDGEKVAVRIYYNVGTIRSRANIGKAYIGMYNASDNSLWGSLETEVNGSVSFIANNVPPGNYYILTSTDIDNDNTVCSYGEICEYYPPLSGTATYFTVETSDISGYELFLQPIERYGGINAASITNNTNQSMNDINTSQLSNSISSNGKIIINSTIPTIQYPQEIKGDKTFGVN